MARGKRNAEAPRERVGLCAGRRCPYRNLDVPLYRVYPIFRYRCRVCYKRETGYYP